MKNINRRIRRRTASHEAATAKKDHKQKQSFFGDSSHETFFQPSPVIQRKCEKCEEEDKKVQKKEEEKKLMRAEDKKEEDKVQRQPEKKEEEKIQKVADKKEEEEKVQKKETGTSSAPTKSVSNYIGTLNGKGQSLSPQTNHFFSPKMGYDFSNVKIHNDKEAAESAKEVNARAYTVGHHIVFNEGQYNTEAADGKKLLAHELTHVAQNDDRKLFRQPSEDMENCKGWRSDPHSITVVAANKIMKEELKWDKVTLKKITKCDIWDPDNKRWGCDFFTNDNRKGSCLILPKQNRLNIRIGRKDGKDGSFYCFYNFTCDTKSGNITLVKDKCEGTVD